MVTSISDIIISVHKVLLETKLLVIKLVHMSGGLTIKKLGRSVCVFCDWASKHTKQTSQNRKEKRTVQQWQFRLPFPYSQQFMEKPKRKPGRNSNNSTQPTWADRCEHFTESQGTYTQAILQDTVFPMPS